MSKAFSWLPWFEGKFIGQCWTSITVHVEWEGFLLQPKVIKRKPDPPCNLITESMENCTPVHIVTWQGFYTSSLKAELLQTKMWVPHVESSTLQVTGLTETHRCGPQLHPVLTYQISTLVSWLLDEPKLWCSDFYSALEHNSNHSPTKPKMGDDLSGRDVVWWVFTSQHARINLRQQPGSVWLYLGTAALSMTMLNV